MISLDGRVALVTGGGRGIGAAVARALAHAGADVVVAARTKREIEAVADELRERGGRAWAVQADVTDSDSVAALANAVGEAAGRVDILVNNAGAAASAPVQRTSLQEWNRLMAVNATAPFLCVRAFLPGMLERRWGRIVTVASVVGLEGGRYIAAYAASKHAAIGMTRSVAAEVAAKGVTVNAVCPGYAETPMTRQTIANIVQRTGRTEQQALDAILEHTPQRRLITPDEVAHTILALCDEDARGVNGQAIVVDGGGLLA